MHDLNWWLMGLAFLLGLLLTLAMMIRRVTREVPIVHTVSAGAAKPNPGLELAKAAGAVTAAGTAAAAKLHGAADKVSERVEHAEKAFSTKVEKVEKRQADVAMEIEDGRGPAVLEAAPYGAGSIRVSARTVGPAGYTVKGDKDTGRYFTEDSADYETIEAEVWFANEESARKAGFLRWDAEEGDNALGLTGSAATVIREDHSADATMVIKSGETAPSEVKIRIASAAEIGDAPYGKGSARPAADGSGPEGWLIKGNADSMLFHGPDSPAYEQTIAEVWFLDEAAAAAAGFDKWDKNFK